MLLGLAAGLLVAGWLTLYQVGLLAHVWDPVFGSRASRAVLDLTAPVPDALAGVIAYGSEIALLLLASVGDRRVRAWTTLGLGAMLTAGVVVSFALIAVQALVVGEWCTLCLCSAALSFALFGVGLREVRTALEYLRRGASTSGSAAALPHARKRSRHVTEGDRSPRCPNGHREFERRTGAPDAKA